MKFINGIIIRLVQYEAHVVLSVLYWAVLPLFAAIFRLHYREKAGWRLWSFPDQTRNTAYRQ